MDTAATIVTGAHGRALEVLGVRARSASSWRAFVYPLYGMWIWGGGWLATLGANFGLGHGALDFAGSSVVHAVGGFSALAGAIVLGPRIGKFKKDGTPVAIPGHHIPMAILGTIILVFGWFGFNGMSHAGRRRPALHRHHRQHDARRRAPAAWPRCSWCGSCGASPIPRWRVNGMLAGLVAITAPCAFVTPVGGGRHRRASPASSSSARSSSSSACSRSTTRSAPSRSTASTARGA